MDFLATYTNSIAMLVGINEYQHAGNLSYAVNDAKALSEALVTVGFDKKNIYLLSDKEATKPRILSEFYELRKKAGSENDRLVFFFAGHGITVKGHKGDAGFLIPYDGDPERLDTLIAWDELTQYANLIPAKHVLFIMDACYSGLALQRAAAPGADRFVSDIIQRFSRQVITAGKADQVVADGGGPAGQNSIFTGHLLNGLMGHAHDSNGVLTANGLMGYVYQRVSQDPKSSQTPSYGQLAGDGDFVFATPNSAHLLPTNDSDFLITPRENLSQTSNQDAPTKEGGEFLKSRGFANANSGNFGRNDLTNNLIEWRRSDKLGLLKNKAFSWLSVLVEPAASRSEMIDMDKLAGKFLTRSIAAPNPWERFLLPRASYTTIDSLVLFDEITSEPGAWIRYLRVDERGGLEFSDAGRGFLEWEGNRIFKFVQILGMTWQCLFLARNILLENGYSLGFNIHFNLVGTKDTFLGDFSKEPGENNTVWRQLFAEGMHGEDKVLKCSDPNIQLSYKIPDSTLSEETSNQIILNIAHKLSRAYNHGKTLRAFNYNTQTFPWQQFLSDNYY